MKKFGSYKILNHERLIVEYHAGDINIDQFVNSRKIISTESNYDPSFDHVFDFREVNMIVNQKDIEKFIIFFKKYYPIIGERKSAYLTNKPNEVVITTIFSMKINDLPIYPNTFSTLNGLVNWIKKKQIDEKFLTKIIDELKTNPNTLYC